MTLRRPFSIQTIRKTLLFGFRKGEDAVALFYFAVFVALILLSNYNANHRPDCCARVPT